MQNYKIVIQYDGTRHSGWQKQGNTENTIQGKIENILTKFANTVVEIQGASRTDADVHAEGQVASFSLPVCVDTNTIHEYLCTYLPYSIAVVSVDKVNSRFHARLNTVGKKYVYRISNSIVPNVFERDFMYQYPEKLNIELMNDAIAYLVGQHDFRAFCTRISKNKSSTRTIEDISLERYNDEVRITYKGDGFLYNMVRILTGTLIQAGIGKLEPEEVRRIILSKDRKYAGPTVPGNGLILKEVYY